MSQTDNTPTTAPNSHRWLVLAVMSLGTLIVFLDLTVVNTALPAISLDLGATTSDLQWVVDAYVLVLAGLLLLAGSIGDRYASSDPPSELPFSALSQRYLSQQRR